MPRASSGIEKKRTLKDERRLFQDKWELLYFCTMIDGKIHFLICNKFIAIPKEYNLKRHYQSNHLSYNYFEGIKLLINQEGPMRVSKLNELRKNLSALQTYFTKNHNRSTALVTGSYEISRMLAVNGKSYSDGDFIKQCLVKTANIICPDDAHLFKDISLTRNTVAEHINEMALNLKHQLKSDLLKFEYFSIAIDETVDIVGIAQLAIFFRACDSDFNIYEEFLELVPMHDTTTSKDIFIKLLQILFEYGFDLKKLVCLCTDGAPNMVGRLLALPLNFELK
ncbi:general transcription factor II-I repeat domain-containing protein 2-like [Octopus sinensis]|uniref:General transcription factor II-I repeat domain-containing protein 2-like n=1 Tax=Octopus sinensis TaxID=2607531 RepID=A0A6P7TRK3_9MOLL|nr:general transcription factor II-I repeat domain-containing protein 2-like [Octopus sinensis]